MGGRGPGESLRLHDIAQKVKSHLSAVDVIKGNISLVDLCGNAAVDALAGKAAEAAQVERHELDRVAQIDAKAKSIVKQLLRTTLLAMSYRPPPDTEPPPASVPPSRRGRRRPDSARLSTGTRRSIGGGGSSAPRAGYPALTPVQAASTQLHPASRRQAASSHPSPR